MDDYPISISYDVICETDGCENQNIVITVLADPESPVIICGPCSQQIMNPTPV